MPRVAILNLETKLLLKAADNPNRMEKAQFERLVEAIETMGFLQPILVRPLAGHSGPAVGYRVIDGHHRLAAAERLGMTHVPSVVVQSEEDEELVLRIGMNRLRGELDLTGVGKALQDLVSQGWGVEDLSITGFSEGEVNDLLASVSQSVSALQAAVEVPAQAEYEVIEDDVETKVFELKLTFRNREELKLVKRVLRRAGGKEKDMAAGLLNLLGEDKEKKSKSKGKEEAKNDASDGKG